MGSSLRDEFRWCLARLSVRSFRLLALRVDWRSEAFPEVRCVCGFGCRDPDPRPADVSVSDLAAGEFEVSPGCGLEVVDVGAGEICLVGVGAGAGVGDEGAGVVGDAGGDGEGGEEGVCCVSPGEGVVAVGAVGLGNAAGGVTRCRGAPVCAGGEVAKTIDGAPPADCAALPASRSSSPTHAPAARNRQRAAGRGEQRESFAAPNRNPIHNG